MTVFISFSGSLSTAVAKLLESWLPDVIQGVTTWLSEGMEKGTIWPERLIGALSTTVGISCVTQENKNAPWLLFEAGMLCKGVSKARVCPLLIDLEKRDVGLPLSIFQLTVPTEEDMWILIKTINAAGGEKQLIEERLKRAFARFWPDFEGGLKEILAKQKELVKPAKRSPEDMIVEILEISRALQRNSEDPITPPKFPPRYTYIGSPLPTYTPEANADLAREIIEWLNTKDNPKEKSENPKADEAKK